MNRLSIIFALAIAATPTHASNWTGEDTAWQAAFTVLQVVDWGQTRNIAHRADTGCAGYATCIERNPFLGRNPSIHRVDTHFVVTTIANAAISYALHPKWRRHWQMINIGFEAGIVGYNYKIGLKMDF